MKAIITSFFAALPLLAIAGVPSDVESVTIPYAEKTSATCGVLQVCEIQFQAGEIINDFTLSDTQNWSITPTSTGEDSKKVHHLILLPVSAGLKTALRVTTNRRSYEVVLESNNNIQSSRKIAFSYQVASGKITDISKLASYVKETPAELAIPSDPTVPAPTTKAQPKIEKPSTPAPKTWAMKPEHRSVRDVIEDWASVAGQEVYWETRDFPLSIKTKKDIHTGDFFEALRILGEAYRESDAPWQVQPTAFQQIVIKPMTKGTRVK